jgi:hypothetical protein
MSGRLPNALELIIGDYQAIFITVYYIEKPKPTEPQNVFFVLGRRSFPTMLTMKNAAPLKEYKVWPFNL